MSKRKGSIFLTQPTIIIEREALASLGEFKFMARDVFPREHLVSMEGFVDGERVHVQAFIDNIEYKADVNGNWLDYPYAAVVKAKQAAGGRQRTWLGTIHSHPYGTKDKVTPGLSETDHTSGHFHSETVSGIYTIKKSTKNGRLYSRPIQFFIPQGQIPVILS